MGIELESSSSESKTAHKTSIESLATELLTEILLQMPDISSLQSLVHASPVLHGAYQAKRVLILGTVLDRDIALYHQDAVAVTKAAGIQRDNMGRSKFGVRAFCEGYPYPSPSVTECLTLDQITALVRLHRVVGFATEAFRVKVLSTYPTSQASVSDQALSTCEDARIRRAFYRYQTFCILADRSTQPLLPGSYPDLLEHPSPSGPEPENPEFRNLAAGRFIDNLPAWQIKEISCVHDVLKEYYKDLLELHREKLYSHGWPLPLRSTTKSCLRDGLYAFQRIKVAPPNLQVQLLQQHITSPYQFDMGLYRSCKNSPAAEDHSRSIPWVKRYHAYKQLAGSGHTAPSLGWFVSHELAFMQKSVGYIAMQREMKSGSMNQVPDTSVLDIKHWKYMMWDEWRLREWGLIKEPGVRGSASEHLEIRTPRIE
ncbi:MAG: hypothetical protein Q9168_005261 [Polycauliona sp. 1 TL-2023]